MASTDGFLEFELLSAPSAPEPGFWVVRGKVFAYTAVLDEYPPYGPCLFLGTFTSSGVV